VLRQDLLTSTDPVGPHSHCSYCGSRFDPATRWPRTCSAGAATSATEIPTGRRDCRAGRGRRRIARAPPPGVRWTRAAERFAEFGVRCARHCGAGGCRGGRYPARPRQGARAACALGRRRHAAGLRKRPASLACGSASVEAVTGRSPTSSSPAPRTRTWSSRSTRSCWPTGSPTSSRPQARRPADAIAGALRLGPHGGATTASWGFVRMAPSPRSPDNRGMLRGAPAVRPARVSSLDDVGRWTAGSTTEAALLVEQSANRRAGACA
jgi:hypothetical protein